MKAYVDSSILLRLVLGEPGRLREWRAIRVPVTSALAEVECLRTLDRLKLRGAIDSDELARCRTLIFELLSAMEVVDVSPPVLSRAASPFPTSLGTLDAIHLATALAFRDVRGVDLVLATHDAQLAQAARAVGLTVIGT
jgi:predicted nucleic acid-binding protein